MIPTPTLPWGRRPTPKLRNPLQPFPAHRRQTQSPEPTDRLSVRSESGQGRFRQPVRSPLPVIAFAAIGSHRRSCSQRVRSPLLQTGSWTRGRCARAGDQGIVLSPLLARIGATCFDRTHGDGRRQQRRSAVGRSRMKSIDTKTPPAAPGAASANSLASARAVAPSSPAKRRWASGEARLKKFATQTGRGASPRW